MLVAGILLVPWAESAADPGEDSRSRNLQLRTVSRPALDVPDISERIAAFQAEETFKRLCAVCHGERGEGNGPAAAALRPKPADLTDPDRRSIPEQQVLEMIRKGKGTMPAFGAVLKDGELEAVSSYVVSLSAEPELQ